MDKENLVPGQEWETAIRTAVSESQIFLACVSHHSVNKTGFVNREITFALDVADEQPDGAIIIIPVRLEKDSPVPQRLRGWHWCDYFERDGYQRLLQALHMRAEQIGVMLAQRQKPLPRRRQSLAFPALPAFSGWFVAAVAIVLLLVGVLSLSGDDNGTIVPTLEPTKPTATEVAVVVEPTATPAPPTATPTNPLFPVTLDQWRTETTRSTPQELTREGDHYWRYVPGGTYKIGGWTDDGHDDNDEAENIKLPSYWLARFPVTNQQYRQFMDAGGYDTREYWTAKGWAWKEAFNDGKGRTQPSYWDDERYNSDNQPVIGLEWYEATAFAAWLNAELADSMPQGTCIRVPTDAEWEVACAYDSDGQRHTYPWGAQEPTSDLADFGRRYFWSKTVDSRPASVGEHRAGVAASTRRSFDFTPLRSVSLRMTRTGPDAGGQPENEPRMTRMNTNTGQPGMLNRKARKGRKEPGTNFARHLYSSVSVFICVHLWLKLSGVRYSCEFVQFVVNPIRLPGLRRHLIPNTGDLSHNGSVFAIFALFAVYNSLPELGITDSATPLSGRASRHAGRGKYRKRYPPPPKSLSK